MCKEFRLLVPRRRGSALFNEQRGPGSILQRYECPLKTKPALDPVPAVDSLTISSCPFIFPLMLVDLSPKDHYPLLLKQSFWRLKALASLYSPLTLHRGNRHSTAGVRHGVLCS